MLPLRAYCSTTRGSSDLRCRRPLLRQMGALAGAVAAAAALIAGIAATPAAASISKTDDPRLKTGRQTYTLGESRRLDVYTAEPVAGMARNRAAEIGRASCRERVCPDV